MIAACTERCCRQLTLSPCRWAPQDLCLSGVKL